MEGLLKELPVIIEGKLQYNNIILQYIQYARTHLGNNYVYPNQLPQCCGKLNIAGYNVCYMLIS